MLDTFSGAKEVGVTERRYPAVLAVIADGRGVSEAPAQFGKTSQTGARVA
jgi:hypothetical protein